MPFFGVSVISSLSESTPYSGGSPTGEGLATKTEENISTETS